MTKPSAKILLDSISPEGHRLTTMEATFHRFILAEMNTHRAFSRNSASSRAIPTSKIIERVKNDPAVPLEWGTHQPGMQAAEPLTGADALVAEAAWTKARDYAVIHAQILSGRGVHKQVVNRLLEPFMWHTAIISATDWDGFWRQRCSPLAQPEIRAVAEAMKAAYDASSPTLVGPFSWHAPLILPEEREELFDRGIFLKVSAARCARVSYLTHDGVRDWDKDVDLFEKLVKADPPHASPLEHVATPFASSTRRGNFRGWEQLRHRILCA